MIRNKDILYRVLNGEKMSLLAKEYLVSNTFIAYTIHRQVKKVMPELYVGKRLDDRYSNHLSSGKPLIRVLINMKDVIIGKINSAEIDVMIYKNRTKTKMIKNAIDVLTSEGYTVTKEAIK